MRIRLAKFVSVSVLLLNCVGLYFVWELYQEKEEHLNGIRSLPTKNSAVFKELHQRRNFEDNIQRNITVIIRGFEYFENDIPNTVRSITSTYPNITILLVTEFPPYPPLFLNTSNHLFRNVRQIHLQPTLNSSFEERTPILQVKGQYVLFMPDSTRIHTKKTVEKMIKALTRDDLIVAATYKATKPVSCLNAHVNQREWLIQFEESNGNTCDFVKGKHAILFKSQLLRKLSDPFMQPFPDAFYIQTASRGIKVILGPSLSYGHSTT